MKVLIYSESVLPSLGGLERFVDVERRLLATYGHEVTLVTFQEIDESVANSQGVVRLRHPARVLGASTNVLAFMKIVMDLQPDVIHFHGPGVLERFAIPLLRLEGFPVVVSFHADLERSAGKVLQLFTDGFSYSLANLVLVQSKRDFSLLRHRGVRASRLRLFHWNGVEKSRLTEQTWGKRDGGTKANFLFVGSLNRGHRYKGLNQLLDFIYGARLEPDLSEVTFTIVGGGDLLGDFRTYAEDRGLTNVRFLGQIPDDALSREYERATGMIVPASSRGEGFSIVAIDAVVMGLPVIASLHAGVSELIGFYGAGIVVDFRNRASVLDAIRRVRYDDAFRQTARRDGIRMIRSEGLILDDSMKKFASMLQQFSR